MATERTTFTRRGGIETWFGLQHRAAIANFHDRNINPIPEDSEKYEYAMDLDLLFPDDVTIRRRENGFLWASFILPTQSKDLPPGTLVERWGEYESAFGLQRTFKEHIAEAYLPAGEQNKNRIKAVRHVNKLLDRLQEGPIEEAEMDELHAESVALLLDAHYLESSHPDRVQFGQQVLRATQPDAKGRPNQPSRRVILASQRPQLITDLTLDEVIAIKNLHRANELESECDFEELALRTFVRRAREARVARIGTGTFDAQAFLRDAHHLLSPKTTILMQPYSALAAELRYGLFARDFERDVITLGKYMPFKDAIEFSDSMPALDRPLNDEDLKRRIEEIALLAEGGVNTLIEERHQGAKPKPPKEKKLTKKEQFWKDLDELYGPTTNEDTI